MAECSSKRPLDSSGSDSDENEYNRRRFKNDQRRINRPQKYKPEWERNNDFKGWLKPVKGITQLHSPVRPVSLVKTEPLTVIKNEPPEYEIAEIGMDDMFVSLDDIKNIDIVSHIIYEDSIKSETVSKDILESKHSESIATQIIIKAENAPLVKIENIIPSENLNKTDNANNANVSEGAGQGVVEVQGSSEDFNALENVSQNFIECYRTYKTTLWEEENAKVKVIKAPLIPAEPHEYTSVAKDKYVCNQCQNVFNKLEYVKFHIQKMHREVTTIYQCPYCPYKSKWSLRYHIIQRHKDIKDILKFVYHCDTCDYKAHAPSLLKMHKIIHAKPEEVQYFHCHHCSQKCNKKVNLETHIFRHFKRGEIPFYCYICDFMTPKRDLIIEHLRKHSKHQSQYDETKYKYLLETRTKKRELRYRCDVCGYKTYTNGHLKRHKLIHLKPEEIQYFYCYHCSYQSKRKDGLKCHISRHFKNEEVAFHCYICDFMTPNRDLIAKHIQKHSKVQIKSEIKEES